LTAENFPKTTHQDKEWSICITFLLNEMRNIPEAEF
jgi:hypothetical protein